MRGQGVLRARESKGKLARRWLLKVAFIAMSSAGKEEEGFTPAKLQGGKGAAGWQIRAWHSTVLGCITHRFNNLIFLLRVCRTQGMQGILVRDGVAARFQSHVLLARLAVSGTYRLTIPWFPAVRWKKNPQTITSCSCS